MFAQTPVIPGLSGPFIILSSVGSTNNYAMAKLHASPLPSGTCFLALEQTTGKGQRGRQWIAAKGQNITMSTVFRPSSSHIFLFSAAMALGCYDFIKALGISEVSVKWPNDIYVGDRKAAGILIENVMKGSDMLWSVAGTGINMNQTAFSDAQGRAISLRQITGEYYLIPAAGRQLHRHLVQRDEWVRSCSVAEVMAAYNARLYKKGETVRLKKDNAVFSTTIRGVTPTGELITFDTMERSFTVGEVELVMS